MKLGFGNYALIVAIILYGMLIGGVVYSHIAVFPAYMGHLPESAVLVNGDFAVHDEYFWTITHPLAVLSLIVALAANWRDKRRRTLIAIPLVVYAIALIVTTIYFVPELMAFKDSQASGIPATEWHARGERWQHLSWLRGGMMFLAYIPLLLALAKPTDESH